MEKEKTPRAGTMYVNKDKETGEVKNFTLNIRPESLEGLEKDAYGYVKLVGFKNDFKAKNPKSPDVNFTVPKPFQKGAPAPTSKPTFKKPTSTEDFGF